jgi:hemolysin-activating ACP:hemolysin acyltransferase
MNKKRTFNMSSEWLTGFTQSDGSFVVSFENYKEGIPVRTRCIFNLTQSKEELELFNEIQKFLGVGIVHKNRENVTYTVSSIKDIIEVIIPLFDNNNLRGSKLLSYKIFKEVALMMQNKKHLTLEGIIQIIDFAYFMNKETSLRTEDSKKLLINNLELKYGKIPKVSKIFLPNENFKELPISLEFVRGLIDGDGSFNLAFRTNRRRIDANFTVITELSSSSVLTELVEFFDCGTVYNLKSASARYQVQSIDQILEKILPKLSNIKFNTIKQEHYETTIKVCKLIKSIGYKTDENLKLIVDLA